MSTASSLDSYRTYRTRFSKLSGALLAVALWCGTPVFAAGLTIPFRVSGATYTFPLGINVFGWVVGAYGNDNPFGSVYAPNPSSLYLCGGTATAHGFSRSPLGAITTFDPTGSVATFPMGITGMETIFGYYCNGTNAHGFTRDSTGTITVLDPPGSSSTYFLSLTKQGLGTGFYLDSNSAIHGFLYNQNNLNGLGVWQTFDCLPGATATYGLVMSGNVFGQDNGPISVGECKDAKGVAHAIWGPFYAERAFGFTLYDPPGSVGTYPTSMNWLTFAMTGYFLDTNSVAHGFTYPNLSTGTAVTFDVTNSTDTWPIATNALNTIAGTWQDSTGGLHGFVRNGHGVITSFDAGGSTGKTQVTSLSDLGLVAGWVLTGQASTGFVFLP